jgi:hypothetical protein
MTSHTSSGWLGPRVAFVHVHQHPVLIASPALIWPHFVSVHAPSFTALVSAHSVLSTSLLSLLIHLVSRHSYLTDSFRVSSFFPPYAITLLVLLPYPLAMSCRSYRVVLYLNTYLLLNTWLLMFPPLNLCDLYQKSGPTAGTQRI